MEKNDSIALSQPEIRPILKPQDSVKVVLNGGVYQLDDATIPFQIGFSSKLAEKKPTHVMVIDVTDDVFDQNGVRKNADTTSERTLFGLEPVNYLQLKKTGEHHLIFILFNDSFEKYEYEKLFSKRMGYDHAISFSQMENNNTWWNQIGYCEVVISVPKELFAQKPETKWSKVVWNWVNSSYKLPPVDECEYRKRKIPAFTIKPIIWLLGFIVRFLIVAIMTVFQFVSRVVATIFGYQPAKFFPHFKEVWWNFLFCYSKSPVKIGEIFDVTDYWFGTTLSNKYFNDVDVEDFHCYKEHHLFGWKFYAPLTIFGLLYYVFLIGLYLAMLTSMFFFKDVSFIGSIGALVFAFFASVLVSLLLAFNTLPTWSNKQSWKKKWDKFDSNYKSRHLKAFKTSAIAFSGLLLLTFFISALARFMMSRPKYEFRQAEATDDLKSVILMVAFIFLFFGVYRLFGYLFPILKKTTKKISQSISHKITAISVEAKKTKETKKVEWLKKSFNLEAMPEKVNVSKAPAPYVFVHRFTIKFWQTKAKVCRPYAKN